MKILITLTYFVPYISGLTKYTENLAKGLARRGNDITVLSMRYDKRLEKESKVSGIRVIRAEPVWKISKGFLSWEWIWASLREVKKVDTVIVNLPEPEALATALMAQMYKKKLIAIYHCDVTIGNKWLESLLDKCNYLILSWADSVVTNTKEYAQVSRVLPKFLSKTEYIYPIIATGKQKVKKGKVFVIGWIGRMAKEKGLEYLLEAIPYLEKKMMFQLKLAGPTWTVGEEKYREEIKQKAEKLRDRVEIVGQLSEEKLSDYYKQIDVLVLPSINTTETLGMVQMEAMVAGVPVVASNLPGVRQPIKETGMGILVPPANPKKIAEGIYNIYKNYNRYNGHTGSARNLFNPEKGLNEFEHLLLS